MRVRRGERESKDETWSVYIINEKRKMEEEDCFNSFVYYNTFKYSFF